MTSYKLSDLLARAADDVLDMYSCRKTLHLQQNGHDGHTASHYNFTTKL